jgi:nucleotide sugar dehydrogenase
MSDVVIVGLGYVGSSLFQVLAADGRHRVRGIDVVGLVAAALNGLLRASNAVNSEDPCSTDFQAVRDADVVVVCVGTPLTATGEPDLSAVVNSTEQIAPRLKQGALMILESTTYPGTTEEIVRPILERHGATVPDMVNLAYSPERLDPGNLSASLVNVPKIVGGVTSACAERAAAFYSPLTTVVMAKGTREAEMAKILENTYRQVNVALVNEFAQVCGKLGIDVWDVIRCAGTKPFGFQSFVPGPGVGGHCIPVDPLYLGYKVEAELGRPFELSALAQRINDSMPAFVAERVEDTLRQSRIAVDGARILLLGVAYKANVGDVRLTPASGVFLSLRRKGAIVRYHDPHVPRWSPSTDISVDTVEDAQAALEWADMAVLLQMHSAYERAFDEQQTPILDTRGRLQGAHVVRL